MNNSGNSPTSNGGLMGISFPMGGGETSSIQYVSTEPMSVANLLSTYPASVNTLGKYARVMDLYSGVDEIMRCCRSGAMYYWRPQRSDYAQEYSLTGGAMSLTPLITPPTVFLTGTLSSAATLNPVTTNAYPGMTFKVICGGILGLFSMTVQGLIGGGVLPLVAGGARTITYTGTGYRAD